MNPLMTPVPGQAAPGSPLPMILFFVGIFAVFYFLIIRPQKRKEKQRRETIAQLRKGDRIVTIGGIHGEVVNIKDTTMIIRVDTESGATLKMNRSAVHRVVGDEDETTDEE